MYDKTMSQKEEKIRVNARVPKSLYDWVCSQYDNTSQAINEGLEKLRESRTEECHTGNILIDIPEPQHVIHEHTDEINELTLKLKETLDSLRAAERNYETQQARIEDLKAQIHALYDQLHTKDDQLHAKDEQIKDQNENMHKQAVHIQSLIQENSRLNTKLLPETTETKKSWWKFW